LVTDDAFIDARTVAITPQINGAITEVPVDDNQVVEAGTPLARIDDRDFRAALDQAKAQIDQANAAIANLDAQVDAQQARIDQAQK
jgi:membrane fusion protein (multidrug efflux system)